jgi:3-oxoacyl-[acyl-carrier protein] reductase
MPLETGLRGKRALVTAASRGIGFGIARALLQEGCRVVISSSSQENLNVALGQLRHLGSVEAVRADLRRREDIEALVQATVSKLGGLDILVYVTGSPKPGLFMEQGYEDWEEASRLLVISAAYLARRAADIMIAQGTGGRILLLASVAIREPIPNTATSNVCRIAVAGIVRTLARELGGKGIRVNGILPGYIRTKRLEQVLLDSAKRRGIAPEQALAELEREIPMGRVGSVEELANAAVFLVSDLSSYINGALLPVDGGYLRSVG